MPTSRDLDLLMGFAFFLIGALLAVLVKAWTVGQEPAVYVFGPGPSEPERTACAARDLKRREEAAE